ncbi:hypothetical protein EDD85DRAFT_826005 [Armillaria nabsnona]|nr:hypothetical protein EDD85DRAFT_826005 [Armillaria nabsnona]
MARYCPTSPIDSVCIEILGCSSLRHYYHIIALISAFSVDQIGSMPYIIILPVPTQSCLFHDQFLVFINSGNFTIFGVGISSITESLSMINHRLTALINTLNSARDSSLFGYPTKIAAQRSRNSNIFEFRGDLTRIFNICSCLTNKFGRASCILDVWSLTLAIGTGTQRLIALLTLNSTASGVSGQHPADSCRSKGTPIGRQLPIREGAFR